MTLHLCRAAPSQDGLPDHISYLFVRTLLLIAPLIYWLLRLVYIYYALVAGCWRHPDPLCLVSTSEKMALKLCLVLSDLL